MCGITGIVDLLAGIAPGDRERVGRMTETLVHRGPDRAGTFLDGNAALGHRRLAIIDIKGGDQPMGNEDGSVQIVFNGQIYNHLALRERLEAKGHVFRTRCDTEVIVHLYEEEGRDCVRSLRGQFAFALWDSRKRTVFLARDRLGIKPLYWSYDGDRQRLLFGSEIKAVLAGMGRTPALDPVALVEYLTFLYVPSPLSIFDGISKLAPASWLSLSPERIQGGTYWDVEFTPGDMPEDEAKGRLEEKILEAVEMRLMSEVPLGAFLSSGIDSPLVVQAMTRLAKEKVKTVTVGFSEAAFDEREGALGVARHLGTDHEEVEVTAEAASVLDRLIWHYDEPFADSSMIPTYYVSEAARRRVTVALSGDGGDESFAGYRRYRFDVLENRLRSLLPSPARSLLAGVGRIYPKADWMPRPLRAKTLLRHLVLDPAESYLRSVAPVVPEVRDSLLDPDLVRRLGGHDPLVRFRDLHARAPARDALSRIQYVDLKTYLPDDILTKVDRAAMAVSLEVRVPLLDHEIVELAARMPPSFKLRGHTGKWILREVLRGKVPDRVVDGGKKGFSVPLRRWMARDLAPIFEERVLAAPAVGLRADAMRHVFEQHRSGLRDHGPTLFGLLAFHLWRDRFLRGGGTT